MHQLGEPVNVDPYYCVAFGCSSNLMMKPIDISSRFHSGTLNDCNKPVGFCLGAFTCWQTRNLLMKSTTSFFMLYHE